MSVPTVGEFKNGLGEFFDWEEYDGRMILVRNVWKDITPTSCRFEQSYSDDGGKSWELNWVATDTRIRDEPSPPANTGSHDFDFEIGNWKTHISRLRRPLSGDTTWLEYDGTSVVKPVWNGRANTVELEVDGPTRGPRSTRG